MAALSCYKTPAALRHVMDYILMINTMHQVKSIPHSVPFYQGNAFSYLQAKNLQSQFKKNVINNSWARPDSNRRPPPCKGDVIPLDHEPNNLLLFPFDNNNVVAFFKKKQGLCAAM